MICLEFQIEIKHSNTILNLPQISGECIIEEAVNICLTKKHCANEVQTNCIRAPKALFCFFGPAFFTLHTHTHTHIHAVVPHAQPPRRNRSTRTQRDVVHAVPKCAQNTVSSEGSELTLKRNTHLSRTGGATEVCGSRKICDGLQHDCVRACTCYVFGASVCKICCLYNMCKKRFLCVWICLFVYGDKCVCVQVPPWK